MGFKNIKVGQVLKVKELDGHWPGREAFIVVVFKNDKEKDDDFYYYHATDEKGLPKNKRPWHSNMYLGKIEVEQVGQMNFEEVEVEGFRWTVTGNTSIDQEMANLDERYRLFDKLASKSDKQEYLEREDRNDHRTNAINVYQFANYYLENHKELL